VTARTHLEHRLAIPSQPRPGHRSLWWPRPRPRLRRRASGLPRGPCLASGCNERVLVAALYAVSFGLVPLLGILCTAIAILHVLSVHGIPLSARGGRDRGRDDVPGLHNTPRGLYYGLAGSLDGWSDVWTFSSAMISMPTSACGRPGRAWRCFSTAARVLAGCLAAVGLASLSH